MENENNEIKLIKILYFTKINREAIGDFVLKSLLLLSFFLSFFFWYYKGIFSYYDKIEPFRKELIIPIAIIFILSFNIEIYLTLKRTMFKRLAFSKFISNNYVENEDFEITMGKYKSHLNKLKDYDNYFKIFETWSFLDYFRYYLYLVTSCILNYFLEIKGQFELLNFLDNLFVPLAILMSGTILFILILVIVLLLILLIFLPLIIVIVLNKNYMHELHKKYTSIINNTEHIEKRNPKNTDN